MTTTARRLADLEGRAIMRAGAVMQRSQDAVLALVDALDHPDCARCRDGVLAAIMAALEAQQAERAANGLPPYR